MDKNECLSVISEALMTYVNKESREFTEDEKKRAAYALNLCMVSVSQIIDYNDIYILEQEYEAILNNLNLEMFPKDEAFLSILKQLLDTITFFRIQEGDKSMIEKEYQYKMKNAIWNAVPNFGLIVAGGSPVTMAVSLASQIGIGYMNYRKAKSENTLDYDKKQWELKKTAIDQFNGLRRELFDTAWRIAERYSFPDSYRLTEKQIKQYNDILMDYDDIRKYERLTTIKDKFIAYPPFWYNYGSTANSISRNKKLNISDDTRKYYKNQAISHFEEYWNSNKYALLREDQMSSACALEEIDLLDVKSDAERINELIDKAVEFSGNANDILQLCAIAFLRIGKTNKAAEIFRILVNEEYNTIINAQILSGIYIDAVLKDRNSDSREKYDILTTRVKSIHLLRMPEIDEKTTYYELQDEFNEKQEDILSDKYQIVIKQCVEKYCIKLARLLPVPDTRKEYPDIYFTEEGKVQRIKDIKELFESSYKKRWKEQYITSLAQSSFIIDYFSIMNEMFEELIELSCIRDIRVLKEKISSAINDSSEKINSIFNRIDNHKASLDDIIWLVEFSSPSFYYVFFTELENQIDISIIGMNEMSRFAEADSQLAQFCVRHGIDEPDRLLDSGESELSDKGLTNKYFDLSLIGEKGAEYIRSQELFDKVDKIIRRYRDKIEKISDKAVLVFHDEQEFSSYINNSKLKRHSMILEKSIAILDDKSHHNVDLLFTVDSIVPIIKHDVKRPISYEYILNNKSNSRYETYKSVVIGNGVGLKKALKLNIPGYNYFSSAKDIHDSEKIGSIFNDIKPMIEEICSEIEKAMKTS